MVEGKLLPESRCGLRLLGDKLRSAKPPGRMRLVQTLAGRPHWGVLRPAKQLCVHSGDAALLTEGEALAVGLATPPRETLA